MFNCKHSVDMKYDDLQGRYCTISSEKCDCVGDYGCDFYEEDDEEE